MNFCKVMQEKSKSMKSTWSTAWGGRAGCKRFQDTKNCLAEVQELDALVVNAIQQVQTNKHAKATAAHDTGWEEELEKFNLKNFRIGEK